MGISNKVSMFYNASSTIFERAKLLRENMTEAELKLWECLKERKLLNLRFRPQHPVDMFIADFYCHPLKLVVEIDGEIHLSKTNKSYDIGREAELERWGLKVVRFTNQEVLNNLDQVLRKLEKICVERQKELH
ncbi:endonuclease [Prolixibacter bellariivorans]|uniref:Endonuclease n=1 Tax=Prolixibacter bellariivorans TaxID=314319 RepID=A0A5M4AWR8_9BACT|nr:endonuclease domain-containing protein [Prolixibacter bellariivorans]GET32370.1 endonuclease [Prolixibacter bellariivorans]